MPRVWIHHWNRNREKFFQRDYLVDKRGYCVFPEGGQRRVITRRSARGKLEIRLPKAGWLDPRVFSRPRTGSARAGTTTGFHGKVNRVAILRECWSTTRERLLAQDWDEGRRRGGGRIIPGREQQVFALPWLALSKGNAYTQLARQFLSTPENDWSHLASVMQFLPRAYTVPGLPGARVRAEANNFGIRISRGRAKEGEETTSSVSWKRECVFAARNPHTREIH